MWRMICLGFRRRLAARLPWVDCTVAKTGPDYRGFRFPAGTVGAGPVAACEPRDDRWLPVRGGQGRLGRGLGNGMGDRSITALCA